MKWTSRPTASEAALALALVGCGAGASPEPPPPPAPDPGEPPVPVRIAAGNFHACAVMSDGTARCWGRNGNAQLGHLCRAGHTAATCRVASPVYADAELQVPLDRVVDLALGSSGSCAVRDDRTVWCWGNDGFGAFATGDRGPSATFPPVQSLITDVVHLSLGWSCCAVLTDESLWCWSTWSDTDTSVVPVRSPWVDRAVGLPSQEPYCALLPDGTVACRGRNHSGQVGDGTFEDREAFTPVVGLNGVVQVARAGSGASCALRSDGVAYCWGIGSSLGNGTSEDDDSPVPVEVALPLPAAAIAASPRSSPCCAILDGCGSFATPWFQLLDYAKARFRDGIRRAGVCVS